jgi:hypothetical protein
MLARRGLDHPDKCPLCDQEEESIDHLLVSCVFARQFWLTLLQRPTPGACTTVGHYVLHGLVEEYKRAGFGFSLERVGLHDYS